MRARLTMESGFDFPSHIGPSLIFFETFWTVMGVKIVATLLQLNKTFLNDFETVFRFIDFFSVVLDRLFEHSEGL